MKSAEHFRNGFSTMIFAVLYMGIGMYNLAVALAYTVTHYKTDLLWMNYGLGVLFIILSGVDVWLSRNWFKLAMAYKAIETQTGAWRR